MCDIKILNVTFSLSESIMETSSVVQAFESQCRPQSYSLTTVIKPIQYFLHSTTCFSTFCKVNLGFCILIFYLWCS